MGWAPVKLLSLAIRLPVTTTSSISSDAAKLGKGAESASMAAITASGVERLILFIHYTSVIADNGGAKLRQWLASVCSVFASALTASMSPTLLPRAVLRLLRKFHSTRVSHKGAFPLEITDFLVILP